MKEVRNYPNSSNCFLLGETMKPNYVVIGLATTVFAAVTLNFSNCSKVAFEASPEAEVLKLSVDGGTIQLDGGNEFTRSLEVVATLNHNSAEEMYVTESSSCSTGGQWEPYSAFKRWQIKSGNAEFKLYAKFKEKAGSALESDCSSDAIIHDDVAPLIVMPISLPTFTKETVVNANFSVSDNLSGVDTIQCRKDSGIYEPCSQSLAMSALTEGNHSLAVLASDKAGNVSQPLMAGFTVDLTPPTLQFNSTPPSLTADLEGRFTFSGVDALSGLARFECKSSDAAPWQTCTSPISNTYVEGVHRVSVRAIDNVGNVSNPIQYQWTIDRTAPSVRITRSPNAYTNVRVASLEFSAVPGSEPIARFECSIDGGAFAACSSPYTSAALNDGRHEFSVRGYDAANNVSQPAMASWVVDTQGPIARIISGPANPTKETMGTLIFDASDVGSGIQELQCQINGSGFQACVSPRQYMNLVEGNYTFQVRAIDRAGNTGAAVSHVWRVDLTPPTVTITSGPLAQTRDINAVLQFVATDGAMGQVARIECRLDNAVDWETCTSPKNYVGLNQGAHSFQVRAIDTVGLISEVKVHNWMIDSMGPAINYVQQPKSVVYPGEAAIVQYAVTDAGSGVAFVTCGLNNQLVDCAATLTRDHNNLPAGNYTFTVTATDNLGNSSTSSVTWKVEFRTMNYNQNILVNANNKADIIVVIDNSGSMSPEQANMATRFGTFLDQLGGLDWQVGIVTTDMATSSTSGTFRKDGRLLPITGLTGQFKLTSAMPLATAKTHFGQTIQRPANEGSGAEQGIAATYRAVERSAMAVSGDNTTGGFIRSGSVLSVVVVTDADETNPAGTQERNRPESLVNLIRNQHPGKAFKYNSIIVRPGDSACLNLAGSGNEGYGYSYNTASTLTGGVIGTVCSNDYGAQLAAMGRATADLVNSATLNCTPVDTNNDGMADVRITTADGSAAPAYTITGLTITFARALPVGNNQLSYTCLVQ